MEGSREEMTRQAEQAVVDSASNPQGNKVGSKSTRRGSRDSDRKTVSDPGRSSMMGFLHRQQGRSTADTPLPK